MKTTTYGAKIWDMLDEQENDLLLQYPDSPLANMIREQRKTEMREFWKYKWLRPKLLRRN